jgi:poly(hydroxyalkanoate) depolymerase family esterase
MRSARWQDLYRANQDTIRRSLADRRGRPVPRARRGSASRAPVPETTRSSPPGTGPAAARFAAGQRRIYTGSPGSRPYRVYTPPDRDGPLPLVIMLHGCTQDAETIAAGTRMSALADTEGFVVAYPEQTAAANRNGCWNWFLPEHQRRDAGEPAILAGIAREVLAGSAGTAIDAQQVYVAGMSAGAGMAAVMAATYPDLFAGAGLHSGLVFSAATSVSSAFNVMRRGVADPISSGRDAYSSMAEFAGVMPTVIVHGSADRTVSPINGEQVARQWLETNRLAGRGSFRPDPNQPSRQRSDRVADGYPYTVRGWDDGTRPVVEYWQVDGLGHAWSGGSLAGSFTDPKGPDAAAAMWQFFRTQPRRSH